jgi:hypothetical protein
MLAYLTNPKQTAIRKYNFTQVAPNLQADGAVNGPCSFTSTCSQIPVTKSVCEDNGGTWWGAGADAPITAGIPETGLTYCCNVNQFLVGKGEDPLSILPLSSTAMRNEEYKLVTNFFQSYDAATNGCVPTTTEEFYAIDEKVPIPRIDREGLDLLQKPKLTPKEQQNYSKLKKQLTALLDSEPPCPGDGNIDGAVNGVDLANYDIYRTLSDGQSSWYDFNLDGLTDSADLEIVSENLGTRCENRG